MTAQQHRESASINASLMVLKSCLRAVAEREREKHRRERATQNDPAHDVEKLRLDTTLRNCDLPRPSEGHAQKQKRAAGLAAAAEGVQHASAAGRLRRISYKLNQILHPTPYTPKRLTHLLQDAFAEGGGHDLVILATVSNPKP